MTTTNSSIFLSTLVSPYNIAYGNLTTNPDNICIGGNCVNIGPEKKSPSEARIETTSVSDGKPLRNVIDSYGVIWPSPTWDQVEKILSQLRWQDHSGERDSTGFAGKPKFFPSVIV